MPLTYKINVLEELKKRGYSTNRLRQERILSESVIQHLRDKQPVSMTTLDKLCELLSLDISDLIAYEQDIPKTEKYKRAVAGHCADIVSKGFRMGMSKEEIAKTTCDLLETFLFR